MEELVLMESILLPVNVLLDGQEETASSMKQRFLLVQNLRPSVNISKSFRVILAKE
jgi:hypothetical protein